MHFSRLLPAPLPITFLHHFFFILYYLRRHLCGFLSLLLEYTKRHPSSCGRPTTTKTDNKKVIWSWVSQIHENLTNSAASFNKNLIVGSDWTNHNPDFIDYKKLLEKSIFGWFETFPNVNHKYKGQKYTTKNVLSKNYTFDMYYRYEQEHKWRCTVVVPYRMWVKEVWFSENFGFRPSTVFPMI